MRNLLLPLALTSFIFLTACGSGTSAGNQKDELETEVLSIHDEAMAKMDEISKLRRSLRALKEKETEPAAQAVLTRDIAGLEQADEVMMAWMRQYAAPDSLEQQEAVVYLNAELAKIEKVKTVMDSTLIAARKTLADHDQK